MVCGVKERGGDGWGRWVGAGGGLEGWGGEKVEGVCEKDLRPMMPWSMQLMVFLDIFLHALRKSGFLGIWGTRFMS